MPLTITGSCHCKNLSFVLKTAMPLAEIRPRACDCSFCQAHAAQNWSDPAGSVIIRVADQKHLQRYRFALRTTDFYICKVCGNYLGAILSDGGGAWSVVNLRLSRLVFNAEVSRNGDEDTIARIRRRKKGWAPTTIVIDAEA